MEIFIISGMSGSGKSKVLRALEDIGYYCIDNIMPKLVPNIIDVIHENRESERLDKLAIGIDARGGIFFDDNFDTLQTLKEQKRKCTLLFLDASDSVLVSRYKETRREHPLSKNGLIQTGIAKERKMLSKLKEIADIRIDTSEMLDGTLKQHIYDVVSIPPSANVDVMIITFGFKRGTPQDCDFLFDVRFLPNPHYEPSLRGRTGQNSEVADYVYSEPKAAEFVTQIAKMLKGILPLYKQNAKNTIVVGIGCTGGKHRSVATASHLAKLLDDYGISVNLLHKEFFME
jgi:UPF0042 nucleotide-binding protein